MKIWERTVERLEHEGQPVHDDGEGLFVVTGEAAYQGPPVDPGSEED